MTFVLSADCGADDTFARVAVIHLPSEADRNSSCVAATAASARNLGSVMLAGPCRCPNIRAPAIAEHERRKGREGERNAIVWIMIRFPSAFHSTHFAVVCRSAGPLSVAIAVVRIRFHLGQSISVVDAWVWHRVVRHVTLLVTVVRYRANRLIFLHWSAGSIFLRFHQAAGPRKRRGPIIKKWLINNEMSGRSALPWILRSELRVATVVPAAAREWIVAAFEFAGHLFVGGASAWNQYHVKSGQAKYRYRKHNDDCNQYESASIKEVINLIDIRVSIPIWHTQWLVRCLLVCPYDVKHNINIIKMCSTCELTTISKRRRRICNSAARYSCSPGKWTKNVVSQIEKLQLTG